MSYRYFLERTIDDESPVVTEIFKNPENLSDVMNPHLAGVSHFLIFEVWNELTLVGQDEETEKQVTERFFRCPYGMFPHKCIIEGCNHVVQFDDEPWCFTHSPDEGSSQSGYSAIEQAIGGHS